MSTNPDTVIIRRAGDSDAAALQRLSELDGRAVLGAGVLLAEVDGTARAAVRLDDLNVVADPFTLTQDLVELLRARAAVLRGDRRPSHRSAHHALPRRLAHTMRRRHLRHP